MVAIGVVVSLGRRGCYMPFDQFEEFGAVGVGENHLQSEYGLSRLTFLTPVTDNVGRNGSDHRAFGESTGIDGFYYCSRN
jgi:hypothetical protein